MKPTYKTTVLSIRGTKSGTENVTLQGMCQSELTFTQEQRCRGVFTLTRDKAILLEGIVFDIVRTEGFKPRLYVYCQSRAVPEETLIMTCVLHTHFPTSCSISDDSLVKFEKKSQTYSPSREPLPTTPEHSGRSLKLYPNNPNEVPWEVFHSHITNQPPPPMNEWKKFADAVFGVVAPQTKHQFENAPMEERRIQRWIENAPDPDPLTRQRFDLSRIGTAHIPLQLPPTE